GLHFGGQRELRGNASPMRSDRLVMVIEQDIVEHVTCVPLAEMDLASTQRRMVHKVAANEIIIVPKAVSPKFVRDEQEPRVLDPPRSKHEHFRRRDEGFPA